MILPLAELPLVGGHAALDLINTIERGPVEAGGIPHDYLPDPSALLLWAQRVELLDAKDATAVEAAWQTVPAVAWAALESARGIRDAVHTVVVAGIAPTPDISNATTLALEHVRAQWVSVSSRVEFGPDPAARHPARMLVGPVTARLVQDKIVEAAVDCLVRLPLERIRQCPPEAGGCGWLFLDQSRNGSRRWCRMADCGSRVKAERLTQRRRVARIEASPEK